MLDSSNDETEEMLNKKIKTGTSVWSKTYG
jgi:hypothetical protein